MTQKLVLNNQQNMEAQIKTLSTEIEKLEQLLVEKKNALSDLKFQSNTKDNLVLVHEFNVEKMEKINPKIKNSGIEVILTVPVTVTHGGYKDRDVDDWEVDDGIDIEASIDEEPYPLSYLNIESIDLTNIHNLADEPSIDDDSYDCDDHTSQGTVDLIYNIFYNEDYVDKYPQVNKEITELTTKQWLTDF